jgi:hypothetical protein
MIGGLLKSASSAALFAALGLVAVAGVSPAKAADLGGDCCADLEERVAELEATTARKGNRKVSLTISGQVTTGVLAWDDGRQSDAFVVDNTAAGATFFVMSGSAKINPALTAGFDLAVSILAGARSNQVTQTDDDGGAAADSTLALIRANWFLDHAQLGRLTVGRINTASAGVVGIDLGGIGVVANANIGYWNAGFETFQGSKVVWGNLLGGATVYGAGLSRANGVMYNSPTVGGFSVAASWGEDDFADVALRYAGEFSGFRLAAAVAYANNVGGLGDFEDNTGSGGRQATQIKGSASLLHTPTGLFVQGSYLTQDNDSPGSHDTTMWQVQGGIAKNWTGIGNTALYGEFARVNDPFGFAAGSESTVWGLGIVQHIDAAAMELFLSYRRFDSDATIPGDLPTLVDAQMDMVFGGARIRF